MEYEVTLNSYNNPPKEGTPEFDQEVERLSTYLARTKTLKELRHYQQIVELQTNKILSMDGCVVKVLSTVESRSLARLDIKREGVRVAIDKHEFQRWDKKLHEYVEK